MSFWLFLRIMIGLLAGKIFFMDMFNGECYDEWQEYLCIFVIRLAMSFVCWWGLTPILNLL